MKPFHQHLSPGLSRWPLAWAVVVLLWSLLTGATEAQETADYFKRNCANCHTVGGGRLVGPDLKNVGQRREKDWLLRFMLNPKGLIDGGDAYAQQLLQEYRGVVMPPAPELTAERAENVLRLLEEESKKERSIFAGAATTIPDRPFTAVEIERGQELFLGTRLLAKGGPACLSCHSALGVTALGGGQLGPDLSQVIGKLQGRKGLAAWLSSPPTPTMQPLYKNRPLDSDEILGLVAFLEQASKEPAAGPDTTTRLSFFLLGLAGTAGGLVVCDFLWRRRFRAVRRTLVQGESAVSRDLLS